ncbi:MAG: hemolysin III family protein [Candidatus Margulisbacteria bacterium]|nr:hemolysin III family protein [Candidatus Margulisiibacteriota bacterium]
MNGILHMIGAALAIPALLLLVFFSRGSALKIISFAIYGLSLFLLYLFSTLHHCLPRAAGGKGQVFRKLDHLAIYALIAGTYTPFCLLVMKGLGGWIIFTVIWLIAIAAISVQAVFINLPRSLTTTGYILMGWLVVLNLPALLKNLPLGGLLWLLAGGIIYSVGGVIYALKKPRVFSWLGFHELWHFFVLGGSACHFIALFFYVALR